MLYFFSTDSSFNSLQNLTKRVFPKNNCGVMFDQLWSAPKWHTFNILVFRLMILRHSFDLKKRGWIALSTALETRYQFTEYIFVLHCEFTWTKLFLCFSLLTLSQSSINVRHNFSFVMINGKLFHIQIYHKVEKHLFSTYLIARD